MPEAESMSDRPSTTPTSRPIVSYLLAAYLIISFLWRAFTPAHEYPGRFSTYLDIGLDILVIGALIGMRARVPQALFWIALIAGVALFAIRFSSEASWWTGHLVYYLRPR
jgi:hypothetical protein